MRIILIKIKNYTYNENINILCIRKDIQNLMYLKEFKIVEKVVNSKEREQSTQVSAKIKG